MKVIETIISVFVLAILAVVCLPELIVFGSMSLLLLYFSFDTFLSIFGLHIPLPPLPERPVPEDILTWLFSFLC
ncbi:hypothetical protein FACS1894170_07010 [Planctomycetales bacterium]|nr:hypothetical protein FACS1894170_07010 [Planctomycetales bacterium]